MNAAVFAYSRRGCLTARQVCAFMSGENVRKFTMERFDLPDFESIGKPSISFYGPLFQWADAMIFVSSCGIAVREIAPYVKDKKTDPAVVAIDETGRFVIPLLSGHIGGANDLAVRLAAHLNATAVVTTATDIHHKFSVDSWAVKNNFIISSMAMAKAVSAAILEQNVPLTSDFPIVTDYPNGVTAGQSGKIGICISCQKKAPFDKTLCLIPRILHLGIGCRRGTDACAIAHAVNLVLKEHQIDPRAIKCVASIDLKKDEAGLLQFCKDSCWPVQFYSAEVLGAVEGEFTASPFVSRITGVDNVCERAASIGAHRLIIRKTVCNGVTVALAAENLEVHFG